MKIKSIILSSFLLIILLMGLISINSIILTKNTNENIIGQSTEELAVQTMDKIDIIINNLIENFYFYTETISIKKTLNNSNKKYEKTNKTTLSLDIILNNPISEELKKIMKLYQKRHNHKMIKRIFITNKYGIIIASTEKISEINQKDKEWWEYIKRTNKNYIKERTGNNYSIEFAIPITDKNNNIIGAINVISFINHFINIINESGREIHREHNIFLLNKEGQVIYSTQKGYKKLELFPEIILKELKNKSGYFIKKEGETHEKNEPEEIYSYAFSKELSEYKELRWIIIIEHTSSKILKISNTNGRRMLTGILILISLSLILGFIIPTTISKPIKRLSKKIEDISKGNLKIEINEKSRISEINQLIESIKRILISMKLAIYKTGIKNKEINFDEYKKSEEIKELNKKILEKIPIGIYIVNKKGDIEYANPKMLDISGISKEKFLKVKPFEIETYKKIGLTNKIKNLFKDIPFKLGPLKYTSYFAKKKTIREFIGIPIKENKKINQAVIIVDDLTSLKEKIKYK